MRWPIIGALGALALALVVCGCSSRPSAAAKPSPSFSPYSETITTPTAPPVTTPSPTQSPSASNGPLIRNTAANQAACQMWDQEQSGQMAEDQFMAWLDEPQNGNRVGSKLVNAWAHWFVDQDFNAAEAEGYGAQASVYCLSILHF